MAESLYEFLESLIYFLVMVGDRRTVEVLKRMGLVSGWW